MPDEQTEADLQYFDSEERAEIVKLTEGAVERAVTRALKQNDPAARMAAAYDFDDASGPESENEVRAMKAGLRQMARSAGLDPESADTPTSEDALRYAWEKRHDAEAYAQCLPDDMPKVAKVKPAPKPAVDPDEYV